MTRESILIVLLCAIAGFAVVWLSIGGGGDPPEQGPGGGAG